MSLHGHGAGTKDQHSPSLKELQTLVTLPWWARNSNGQGAASTLSMPFSPSVIGGGTWGPPCKHSKRGRNEVERGRKRVKKRSKNGRKTVKEGPALPDPRSHIGLQVERRHYLRANGTAAVVSQEKTFQSVNL